MSVNVNLTPIVADDDQSDGKDSDESNFVIIDDGVEISSLFERAKKSKDEFKKLFCKKDLIDVRIISSLKFWLNSVVCIAKRLDKKYSYNNIAYGKVAYGEEAKKFLKVSDSLPIDIIESYIDGGATAIYLITDFEFRINYLKYRLKDDKINPEKKERKAS